MTRPAIEALCGNRDALKADIARLDQAVSYLEAELSGRRKDKIRAEAALADCEAAISELGGETAEPSKELVG